MAGFNISNFISHVNANGLMRNNKFLVRIPYPIGFDGIASLKETSRYMELWCDSTSLPGININTADVKRYGYGPVEKMGVTAGFNNVTLTFMSDNKALVHSFFYNWTKLISNHDARNGDFNKQSGLVGGGMVSARPYEIAYKNDYVSNIEITVFNEGSKEIMTLTLRDAFPVAVGDIQLNWADTNDFVRIPVSLTFTDIFTNYKS
jgi:hypothetical protein